MNSADPNDLKTVLDYVVQIRGQDLNLYQTLLTVFVGAVFVAVLVGTLAKKEDEQLLTKGRKIWVTILCLSSLFCFIFFAEALRIKHHIRKEFCFKWMANNIDSNQAIPELIKDFSAQRYGLYYANPKDPNFVLREQNKPDSKIHRFFIGRAWIVPLSGWTALFLLCLGILVARLRSQSNRAAPKEITIKAPGQKSSIRAEGKLEIVD